MEAKVDGGQQQRLHTVGIGNAVCGIDHTYGQ
jgi:hypothetical protein